MTLPSKVFAKRVKGAPNPQEYKIEKANNLLCGLPTTNPDEGIRTSEKLIRKGPKHWGPSKTQKRETDNIAWYEIGAGTYRFSGMLVARGRQHIKRREPRRGYPMGSVPIQILALIDVTTAVGGRIQHQGSLRKKKKLPLNLRGKVITPITTIYPTELTPVTEIGGSSYITPRVEKGKTIATENDTSLPKLIPNDQLQDYLDKKEQIEQAMKEAKLSEPKIKKVVTEIVNEAEVQIKGTKYFLKHQDAHFQVLVRAHNKKLKKKADQRKK
ncbi:hypothetical protein Tco_0733723, partial [Tanacetum coccineum]